MDASKLLRCARIVPVIVIENPRLALPLAESLLDAGLDIIEVTLRTTTALESIESIAAKFPMAVVGAGSVRTAHQFVQIKDAGAQFAVCPGSTERLLDTADECSLPFVPGATTASEVVRLHERGYTLMKFFPAELAGGTRMLQALGAPLPEARFFPTGGISAELATDYLALPNVSCIGGSWITPGNLLKAHDFNAIAKLARNAIRLTV